MEEISLGDGNTLTPLEVIRIYNQTGNVIGASTTQEGDYNYGRQPITELKNGVVDGLDRLISTYNHYLNLLRDAIGIGAGADTSSPHPDTLVGVNEQSVLNSNTATRHILDSSLNISERLGEGLCLRLTDIFKYSDLKKVYINAIGTLNVDILKALNKFHLHDLGVNITLKPDGQDRQMLEANINQALARELITLDDAIDIRDISNTKLANQLIKIRRVKREEKIQENAMMMEKQKGEAAQAAAQAQAQAKQMELQAKANADMQLAEMKTKGEIDKIEAEKQAKLVLMQAEFDYNMTLKGVDYETSVHQEKNKQKNKMDLQDRASTQESKKIEQKANNLPAQSFESSEDNISGSVEMGEVSIDK